MTAGALEHTLLLLFVILAAGALFGAAARFAWQPAVCGELAAGIALGPSLLGQFLPADIMGDAHVGISVLADVGVIALMFTLGCELDLAMPREQRRVVGRLVIGSVTLPVLGGSLVGLAVIGNDGVQRVAGILFIAVAMAVTAFPVLARILVETGLDRTQTGRLATCTAAINDLAAWILLAVVAALAQGLHGGIWHIALVPVYAVLMVWFVRPLLHRSWVSVADQNTAQAAGMLAVAGLFLSSWATQWMGISYIMGAFVYGVCMPRRDANQGIAGSAAAIRFAAPVTRLLTPIFFVVAGMSVDLTALDAHDLLLLAVLLLVAIFTKFVGTYVGARSARLGKDQARVLAVLMNTRGLTELVVLSTGLQLGVIDRPLYSILVIVALITTSMTGPLLRLLKTDVFVEMPPNEDPPVSAVGR